MGGRIHGFLGGVLLALLLTYYTAVYIRKNQQFVSTLLQALDSLLNHRVLTKYDEWQHIQPVDAHVEYVLRPFSESCKDIWNGEMIKMVNWLYSINWYKLGEKADELLNKLTDSIAHQAFEKK